MKAGTQVIDRAWKVLKERVKINQNCKTCRPRLGHNCVEAVEVTWVPGKTPATKAHIYKVGGGYNMYAYVHINIIYVNGTTFNVMKALP